MIRHSSSFLVSLIFHALLALFIFLVYEAVVLALKSKKKEDKRVNISLCKSTISIPTPPKVQVKKVIPPKVEKQVVIKPVVSKVKEIVKAKKKVIVKKPPPKIEKPQKIKEIPKQEILTQVQEPINAEIKKVTQEPEIIEVVQTETTQEKNTRLEKDYISEHIQKIKELLENNLYYPRSARKRGIEGDVIVKFTLLTTGEVHSIKVKNSQNEILSRAAVKTIEDISSDFPNPTEDLTLHVPISYKLSR